MPRAGGSRRIVASGFSWGEARMPQWRTRLVAPATMLLVIAVSLGGGWLGVFHPLYLDW
jgi:hypothetical protein